jgi:UDP-N-acetylglucosamine acyltransferase
MIHPTAIISDKAIIGKNNHIGAYVVIHDNVTIGNNNYIGEHCIIGDIGESINFFDKETKGVIIGNNNRFTKQVTIDNGTVQPTIVRDNTLILKNGHVGHDALLCDNTQVRANALVGGHVIMNEGSIICLSVVIQPRIALPINAYIGACSNVTKKSKLIENFVHYGNPCKPVRLRD